MNHNITILIIKIIKIFMNKFNQLYSNCLKNPIHIKLLKILQLHHIKIKNLSGQ